MLVSNPKGHPVLARIALPYTDPADAGRFASIHSNPPGPETEYPAAILGKVGEGKVLWLSFCPEKAQAAAPRQVTRNLIGLLQPASIVATDAHPCLELTLFDDGEGYIPVSYTHLDVYKRQALSRPPSLGTDTVKTGFSFSCWSVKRLWRTTQVKTGRRQ